MTTVTSQSSLMRIEDFAPFVHGLDHPEGVTTGPDGTIYAGGEAGQIYRVDLAGGWEQIATTGGFILGLCLDRDGAIYACDLSLSAVMRIAPDGSVSPYSGGAVDRAMNVPNYPVFDAAGNLYVSDSGGWKDHGGCLFRIRPGGETEVIGEGLEAFPNGMALHPDGDRLYVVLSNLPGVVSLELGADGSVGPPQSMVELPRTVPDGLAFDVEGNLYIACYTPDVIFRLTPGGSLAILAEDWESVTFATPTNVAFAGPGRETLVVASLSRWHLTKGAMPIAGAALRYPKL
ncbi:MAG: SMP-30/gluconolactonase/LRE family protein [Thermomicrobiales bacterium]